MSKSRERCLVIGANGFVGSHLVDELVEAGYQVRAFDRFSRSPNFDSEHVEVIAGDIFDDIAIHNAMKDVDFIFHSFSATTPFVSDADPYSDITLNVLRNVQLFEKAVEMKIKKFIFISSGGAVYGSIAEHKRASETDAPMPVSPYGIGKLGAEYYLSYFKRKYGLDYIAYRLTNPYGPRQVTNNNQGVIPSFINKIRAGEELIVYGDGSSSRDYVYVRDATKMMVDTFYRDTKHTTYNIGSGKQTNLNDIIGNLEKIMDVHAKVSFVVAPKTFLQKSLVSIDRFESEFGEAHGTTLLAGLKKTIAGS